MKKLLLVSDEKTPEDSGRIENSAAYGLAEGLWNLPNLRAALARQGDFEIVTLHHTQLVCAQAVDYVVLSGRFSPRNLSTLDTEYRVLFDFIRRNTAPMLGICAGLQLISHAFGGGIKKMDDPDGEFGFTELTVCENHPLTRGLGASFSCMQLHHDMVCAAPEGFSLLARTQKCPVQMLAHETRPIAAMQFHPELQNDAHRDGETLLQNFFALY